jgi:membrane-associated phospholipid phosphatase
MRSLATLLLAAAMAAAAPVVVAQTPDAQPPDPAPILTLDDALWAGGFLIGAAALAPLDVHIAREIQDSIRQEQPVFRAGAGALRLLGFPGSLIVTGGLYGGGLLLDQPGIAAAGLHATEAVVAAEIVTLVVKGLAGRGRPFLDPGNPFNFHLGRGIFNDDYQAFPSGHTSAAFAVASALTAEIGNRNPDLKLVSGTLLYSTATLVGISRLYHNAHWATDVIVGAAIGTFAGWTVVRYHHRRPDNPLDRALLSRTHPPAPAVPIVLWSMPIG